jgi:hypothetical protein
MAVSAGTPGAPSSAQRSIASPYLRPLTLADVLDGMFDLWTANWRVYVLAVGVVLIPTNALTSYLSSEVFGGMGLLEQMSNSAAAEALVAGGPAVGPLIGLLGVMVFSLVVVTPFVNGVACYVASEGYHHRSPATRPALAHAAGHYLRLIGVTALLLGIMVVLATFPALALYLASVTQDVPLAVIASLLVIAAGIAAVMLFIRLSLGYVVVVVEGTGPVVALRRSWQLVSGRFWRVGGTLILTGLVAGLVAWVVSLPFALPGELFGDAIGVVFTAMGGVIGALLATPLAANAQTLLYYDGRVRVEGYDLDILSRQVVADTTGGQALG